MTGKQRLPWWKVLVAYVALEDPHEFWKPRPRLEWEPIGPPASLYMRWLERDRATKAALGLITYEWPNGPRFWGMPDIELPTWSTEELRYWAGHPMVQWQTMQGFPPPRPHV